MDDTSEKNWVDIEQVFYRRLKEILKGEEKPKVPALKELNATLGFIIEKLEQYLSSLNTPSAIIGYERIFSASMAPNDYPRQTLFLNFNYTSTVELYLDNCSSILRDRNQYATCDLIYIHGKLKDEKNKLIFGFGDELDKDYEEMERENIDEYFKYIKSFWYFRTPNYSQLENFINSSEGFEVYILGHSCGLSDRTMLNMIFESQFCRRIKIFYHVLPDSTDRYTELTYSISRTFKEKTRMRSVIQNKQNCEAMPQLQMEPENESLRSK